MCAGSAVVLFGYMLVLTTIARGIDLATDDQSDAMSAR